MVSIDTALTWVSWAFTCGAIMGTFATAALAIAVRWGELPVRRRRGRVRDLFADEARP